MTLPSDAVHQFLVGFQPEADKMLWKWLIIICAVIVVVYFVLPRLFGRREKPKVEIERKFLVKPEYLKDLLASASQVDTIAQGYLNDEPCRTVRVRLHNDKGVLTIKGIGSASGMSRFEWEKDIDGAEAKMLMPLCLPGLIEKLRHLVRVSKHSFEIDVFGGANAGLVLAEIELTSEDEEFERPAWLGEEVTGDKRYYNAYLAKHPFTTWATESSEDAELSTAS
jgi:CYTH domain-containing protein